MNMIIAYSIIRVALGWNILLHGLVRIQAGRTQFKNTVQQEFSGTFLNSRIVGGFATLLPILESIVGMLLLLGLFTEPAILLGSFLMLLLITGKSLVSDWPTVTFQMIYVACYALLEMLLVYNRFSVDQHFHLHTSQII